MDGTEPGQLEHHRHTVWCDRTEAHVWFSGTENLAIWVSRWSCSTTCYVCPASRIPQVEAQVPPLEHHNFLFWNLRVLRQLVNRVLQCVSGRLHCDVLDLPPSLQDLEALQLH